MKISMIVAMARNRVIGGKNRLPWYLPEDLKKFRILTTGHIIIMGRKTFEGLPKVLPGRDHYVITRSPDYKTVNPMARDSEQVFVAGTPDEALQIIRERLSDDEVFVIGGGEIFRQMLPLADRIYMTEIKDDAEGDVFFPETDPAHWKEVSREVHDTFDFVVYDRT
ncbi:MAG: dihydrofolate reductase [Saccharofermentanales bacterium]